MKRSQTIFIQLQDRQENNLAISDVFLDIHLFLNKVYRYGFRFGPTSELGTLEVTFADLEERWRANSEAFPMDCGTKVEECDTRIRILLPSKADLDEAYQRSSKYYAKYAPKGMARWPKANNRLLTCKPVDALLVSNQEQINLRCERVER